MVRGGCKKCGSQTTNNRLCNDCQMLEDRGFFADSGDRDVQDNTDDDLEYRCTSCGHEYTGSTPCPECDARRRRYIGPIDGEKELVTDGGVPVERPNWTPTTDDSTSPSCQNCGAQVTRRFTRVFGDNGDVVHACPDCATYRAMKRDAANADGGESNDES